MAVFFMRSFNVPRLVAGMPRLVAGGERDVGEGSGRDSAGLWEVGGRGRRGRVRCVGGRAPRARMGARLDAASEGGRIVKRCPPDFFLAC